MKSIIVWRSPNNPGTEGMSREILDPEYAEKVACAYSLVHGGSRVIHLKIDGTFSEKRFLNGEEMP